MSLVVCRNSEGLPSELLLSVFADFCKVGMDESTVHFTAKFYQKKLCGCGAFFVIEGILASKQLLGFKDDSDCLRGILSFQIRRLVLSVNPSTRFSKMETLADHDNGRYEHNRATSFV